MFDVSTVVGLGYLAIWALLAVDAFVPVVPTQLVMITAGVLVARGDLDLFLVVVAGAAGVFTGDDGCYRLGRHTARTGGPRGVEWAGRWGWLNRLVRGERVRHLALGFRRHGLVALLLCRFVPGGRMAACFHAGHSGYPRLRFVAQALVAAIGYAGYGALAGRLVGDAALNAQWIPLALAATVTTMVAVGAVLASRRHAARAPAQICPPVASPPTVASSAARGVPRRRIATAARRPTGGQR